ncbi:MAG: LysM peptidoglycan-binding domain-containing protein [Candidatus Omnitrophota bacterium]
MRLAGLVLLALVFALSGCVVRTYPVTKDRVDQDLAAGNRGYLMGQAPATTESPERKSSRTTRVVEIELHPPFKFEKMPKTKTEPLPQMPEQQVTSEDDSLWGNRGLITQAQEPEIEGQGFERYTVQKGDTLQKISQRFYGTTRKWQKIYEANQDTLKSPNKVYPGQALNIPMDAMEGVKGKVK